MFAPRVFVSMIGALTAFAIVTYFLNGSIAATAVQTLICAVLMQVGYFIAILFLVWNEAHARRNLSLEKVPVAETAGDEKQSGKVSIRGLNRSGHFNP